MVAFLHFVPVNTVNLGIPGEIGAVRILKTTYHAIIFVLYVRGVHFLRIKLGVAEYAVEKFSDGTQRSWIGGDVVGMITHIRVLEFSSDALDHGLPPSLISSLALWISKTPRVSGTRAVLKRLARPAATSLEARLVNGLPSLLG
jgi:hypothetical protein